MSEKVRLAVPRQIRAGALPVVEPGGELVCAVLAGTGSEWVGADLATGALVRNEVDALDEAALVSRMRPLDAVRVRLGRPSDVRDPARPEALWIAAAEPLGRLAPRRARKLLRQLAAPERDGATILGTRGPSIAFEELDGSTPSVMLVALDPTALELELLEGRGARCQLEWAGLCQSLPIADPHALSSLDTAPARRLRGAGLATALGFSPSYAVIGLARVVHGHAPKVVLSLLGG